MPYIPFDERRSLERNDKHEITAGELNYSITMLCLRYLKEHGECYQTYNDILGVLGCSTLELYRRKVAPYEDIKIIENGDVL